MRRRPPGRPRRPSWLSLKLGLASCILLECVQARPRLTLEEELHIRKEQEVRDRGGTGAAAARHAAVPAAAAAPVADYQKLYAESQRELKAYVAALSAANVHLEIAGSTLIDWKDYVESGK